MIIENKISENLGMLNEQVFCLDQPVDIVVIIEEYIMKKTENGLYSEVLTKPQMVLFHIETLEREIYNGGFYQYFSSAAGDYSHEAFIALHKVGAFKLAHTLKKAGEQFPGGKVSECTKTRLELLPFLSEKEHQTWEDCNNTFYKSEYELLNCIIQFIRKNKSAIL